MNGLFDVVFCGEVDDQLSKAAVQENLKKAVGASDDYIQKMFSGRTVYMKKDIQQDDANSLRIKLAKLGALVSVEPSSKRRQAAQPTVTKLDLHSIAPDLKLVDMETQTEPSAVQPQVFVVERQAAETIPELPEKSLFSFIIACISGFFWLIVGLSCIVTFSPFSDGSIRRGTVLGLLLCGFGCYRIITRHKV
jgi:hypothetical protein